ncbi:MAG: alkaline phosphatase family protein [Adhaeribacter sp.]
MTQTKLLLFLAASWLALLPARAQKVVFVHLDGVPADVLEKVPTPHIDAIAAAGAYTRAYIGGEKGGYSQTPTISAPGYHTLLTGAWGNKHNVWDNDIKDPNYNYWSLFRFVEEAAPQKKTAIFSTWLDNRTKLIGENLPATGNLKLDYHFDGFELDTLKFPHDERADYIHRIDEHVVAEASRYIAAEGPDLSWVYLEYTDDMGHSFGDSEQMYEALKKADVQMGRIWQAIRQRQDRHQEKWLMIVTTDHGRDSQTGKNHGGQSDRERTVWMVLGGAPLNAYAQNNLPATVDIASAVLRFMNIAVPRERTWELDGVPLIGEVSLTEPKVQVAGDKLSLSWKPVSGKGKVKIWLSTTNDFQKGEQDKYVLLKRVPLSAGSATVDVSRYPSSFYKVVLEGKHNAVNRWVKR